MPSADGVDPHRPSRSARVSVAGRPMVFVHLTGCSPPVTGRSPFVRLITVPDDLLSPRAPKTGLKRATVPYGKVTGGAF